MARTRLRDGEKASGEPLDKHQDATKRWFNAPQGKIGTVTEVGQLLFQELAAIERSQLRRRYFNYVCALLVDGEAPPSFGYSMTGHAGREMSAMSTAEFRPPSLNAVAQICDTLKERIWSRVSWLEWLPVSKSDYESRQACTAATNWMHAFNESTGFDAEITQCGQDASIFGTAIMKTAPSRDGMTVVNTRVMIDEMRVSSDADFTSMRHAGQVSFESKDDLIRIFSKGKDADVIRKAIQDAPPAHRGFLSLPVNYSDVIAVCEAYRWDQDDEGNDVGRHVMVLGAGGFTLVDEAWTLGNPYSVLRYNKLSRSWRGKGVPENTLAMQIELDRMVAARAEFQRQMSYPHIGLERSAHIDPNSLEGAGFYEFSGTPAKFDVISGTPKDLDAGIDNLERKIFMREGISQNTAGGDLPAGLDAGVAITAFQTVADGRLFSHAKNAERFIEEIGEKVVRVAAVVKPKATVGEKEVSWSSVSSNLKKSKMRAFPVSKLPSSLPGQLATIEDWSKSGQINQAQRARLLALPDPTGQLPLITASENATASTLDQIVAKGLYLPPDSQCDPQGQYEQARARYLVEKTNGLPMDRIAQLLKFVNAAKAMQPAPAPAPGPGPAGPPVQ